VVADPDRSRFGLEDIYLHPVFARELNYIPQDIGGSNILLTAKILAESAEKTKSKGDFVALLLQKKLFTKE
jgi:hypothetical protein